MIEKLMLELWYNKEDIELIKESYSVKDLKEETLFNNIKRNYYFFLGLGYKKEEVIKMTKSLLSIYGLNINNIKEKIDFYKSIELNELILIDTKQLMQSVDLSYARYQFYKNEKNEIITMDNYRKLFASQKRFEKSHGISKKDLIEKYNYDKYIEEQEKQK